MFISPSTILHSLNMPNPNRSFRFCLFFGSTYDETQNMGSACLYQCKGASVCSVCSYLFVLYFNYFVCLHVS